MDDALVLNLLFFAMRMLLVNFQMSAILCSLAVNSPKKSMISFLLNIPIVEIHEKHLCLPTSIVRNKRSVFRLIRDKFWRKVQSWVGNLFARVARRCL